MKTIFFILLFVRNYAVLIVALVALVFFVVRWRRLSIDSVFLWLIGFILSSGLALIALIATIIGAGLSATPFVGLLLIPAVPSLVISGGCTYALWRCRPKEGLTPRRIAGIVAFLLIVVCVVGAWLEKEHSKTVTFEIFDSANRHVNSATIDVSRSTWVLSGLVPVRHYHLLTDNSGLATLQTWDFDELEAIIKSPSETVTIEIKQSDTIKNQFNIEHTWYTSFNAHQRHGNSVVTFIPIVYPLHIKSYLMPEKEFKPNSMLEDCYKYLLLNPDSIFKQIRNLPFSLLLIKNDTELENIQLTDCPSFFTESCTLSEFYSGKIVSTLNDLNGALNSIREKLAAQELDKLLAFGRRANNADLVRELDNMENKSALEVIKKNLGKSRVYEDSLREVLQHLGRDGTEVTPAEIQLLSSGETIVGLEHLEIPWREAAIRLIPVVESKLAAWKEKLKAVDERHRLLRERLWQQEVNKGS